MGSMKTRHEPDPIRDGLRALKKVGVITGYSDILGDWQISFPGDRAPRMMDDDKITEWIDGAMAGLQATGFTITNENEESE